MMKPWYALLVASLGLVGSAAGCGGSKTYAVTGVAEKGPFNVGSSVTVQELDRAGRPTAGATCTGCLTIVAFAVTSVDPSTLVRGTSDTFDIRGAGFAPGTRVLVRGTDITVDPPTFIDSTHLRVRLAASSAADLTTGDPTGTTRSCPTCSVTIVP